MLQAESQVNQVAADAAAGHDFEVERMDPTVFPIISYSLTSDTRSLIELRDLAQYQLRPVLSTVPGVAKSTCRAARSRNIASPSIRPSCSRWA